MMRSSRRYPLAATLAIVVLGVLIATAAAAKGQHQLQTAVGTQAALPPKPTIRGTIIGKRARIAYSFSTWPSNPSRRPVELVTAVQGSGTDVPYVQRHKITKRQGIVWQPLGLGTAPFMLRAAAYDHMGRRSPIVSVRLRRA